jgi:hypothetical protein
MTAIQLYGTLTALAAVLACGDSGDGAAQAKRPARAPVDLCALLTPAEAEAILGTPVAAPQKASSQCTYAAQSGRGDIMLHQIPMEFGSKEEFHAFLVEDTKSTNERIKKGFEGTGATAKETTVDPAPEVGSPAYYVDPSLVIFKEGRVLSIIAADRKQAVAVAAKAVPRF